MEKMRSPGAIEEAFDGLIREDRQTGVTRLQKFMGRTLLAAALAFGGGVFVAEVASDTDTHNDCSPTATITVEPGDGLGDIADRANPGGISEFDRPGVEADIRRQLPGGMPQPGETVSVEQPGTAC